MKKGIKIALIAGGCVIGLGAFGLAFSGLPVKLLAKKTLDDIDWTAGEYSYAHVETPADYQTLSMEGITLKAPAKLHQKSSEGAGSRAYIADDSKSWIVLFMSPFEFGELPFAEMGGDMSDSDEDAQLAEKLIGEFAGDAGQQLDDWYSFYDTMYSLTMKDCNIHSFRKAGVFYVFGMLKQTLRPALMQDMWNWHTEDGDGFIQVIRTPESDPERNCWSMQAELFPPDDRNTSYSVMITAPDIESAAAIINSIRLTNES